MRLQSCWCSCCCLIRRHMILGAFGCSCSQLQKKLPLIAAAVCAHSKMHLRPPFLLAHARHGQERLLGAHVLTVAAVFLSLQWEKLVLPSWAEGSTPRAPTAATTAAKMHQVSPPLSWLRFALLFRFELRCWLLVWVQGSIATADGAGCASAVTGMCS